MLVQATADLAVDAKNCSVGKGSAIPGYHSCTAPRIPKGRPGDAGGSDDTMNPTEEKSGLMVPCTLNPGGALGAPQYKPGYRGAVSKWQRAGTDAAGCHARRNPGSQTCGPPSLGREAPTSVLWRLATRKADFT